MKTKILDCTIRDGGYLNNWDFDEILVKDLYRSVSKSGTDYIEIGFRSSDKYFNSSEVGIWRFTPENIVEEIIKNNAGSKISLMVDFGKVDLSDIPDAALSKVSLYRVAAHKNQILDAIVFANSIAEKGYEVALQLMGVTRYTHDDFELFLKPLKDSKLTYLYFADSYGSLLPNEVKRYIEILKKTKKKLGFHPHNNMQLGLANTLEAINLGIDIVDGTVAGMGRGAGNMPLETLIAYCQKSINEDKYNVLPILDLIDRYFLTLMKDYPWGYSLYYMISGVYEAHPNYAKHLSDNDYSMEDIRLALKIINQMDLIGFDKKIISKISDTGFIGNEDKSFVPEDITKTNKLKKPDYADRHKDRNFLVIANGPSIIEYKNEIKKFIKKYNPIIIGSNSLGGLFTPDYHVFNNKKLFEKFIDEVSEESMLLVPSSFNSDYVKSITPMRFEFVQTAKTRQDRFDIIDGVIENNYQAVAIVSIAISIAMGASQVFIAGMDGYKDFETFFQEGLIGQETKKPLIKQQLDISNRSGTFQEQMQWHNYVERSLRQINDYLISNDLNDMIIITPTSHKMYYLGISNCLDTG